MSDAAIDIAAAEARAVLARDRLTGSLQLLQARLKPKTLARDAAQSAATAGQNAARAGVEAARHHPGPVAGVAAAAGLFLARHRILALFRRGKSATGTTSTTGDISRREMSPRPPDHSRSVREDSR